MSLLEQLDGARLVVVDDDLRLAFVWYGGYSVNVYDEDGNERDYFSFDSARPLSVAQVHSLIQQHREEIANESDEYD